VGEAFACEHPAVTVLETAVVTAVERSGRLEHGLQELANYFGGLAQRVPSSSSVRLSILHPALRHFRSRRPDACFSRAAAVPHPNVRRLFFVYAVAAVIALLVPMLGNVAATSAVVDRLLRTVPLIGKIRRSFALSRFCTVTKSSSMPA
jgi:type II secretory pathway component PulF